jgi:hypothetical protein
MRLLAGAGTPRELQAGSAAGLGVVLPVDEGLIMLFVVAIGDQTAVLLVTLQIDPFG